MDDLADGVRAGHRSSIARAITLVESRRADHREQAQQLLAGLLPATGGADVQRIGVSGVPGVGKSTFIDQFGVNLISEGHRVAVLAVDPSSGRTGGSILGDKTRMGRLSASDDAFVRPSPSAGTLGGVAQATRETMLVMEAAGYDVVLVETVGVGQSEYVVADMVDTFLFLTLARTGDQLQGMKRGILELTDVIAVNKADEEHEDVSERSARELSGALRLLRGTDDDWQTPVVTCSALHDVNLDRVWKHITRHRDWLETHGGLERKRREQAVQWTRAMVRDRLLARLETPDVRGVVKRAEDAVRAGEQTPDQAADAVLDALDDGGGAPS
ncbi:methylmalonyl Co-A mutase-associated GTPase MeaB [uncultured Jatrophihabitans sp.]|uniref:methylmalonyl Co-A mutase-associated GTPase MeaB n=1 Tax=uncultured Jatrophihabitans sp. TaxID=1610747 RepID=UPI0035C9ECFB